MIGGIAGDAGKGAAIGAVVGGTASVVQKGQRVSVSSEPLLEFRLEQPASFPESVWIVRCNREGLEEHSS